jgi:hypothetical protein
MNLNYFRIFSIAVTILILGVSPHLSGQDGRLIPFPQAQTVVQNQEFNVLYRAFPGSSPVSVVDFLIRFDTSYVQCLGIDDVGGPLNLRQIDPVVDNSKGTVLYGAFTLRDAPEELFSLISIRFRAIMPIDETLIEIVNEGHPQTLMAYAGMNTMDQRVMAASIKIHPDIVVNDAPPKEVFKVDYDKTSNTGSIVYLPKYKGAVEILLKEEKDKFQKPVFANMAYAGFEYNFAFDFASLPAGNYKAIVKNVDGTRELIFFVD